MPNNLFKWLKKTIPNSRNFLSFSRNNPTIKSFERSLASVNEKIWNRTNLKEESVPFESYERYFENLKSFGLWKDFELRTSKDSILLKGSVLNSPIVNDNNEKVIIFCHGITSSKWSLFYCIHLVLQLGYKAIIYDARNHGSSEKSYNTLGKIESQDLEDIIKWTIKNYKPEKIGLYGFSMGSATLLFWIGQFQDDHPEVAFAICDSPFDSFKKRFLDFLNINETSMQERFQGWKRYFFHSITMKMLKSPIDVSEINPILALPEKLNVKLLLLHGLGDTVIPWESSVNIWEKLNENPANKGMVNLYLFDNADHGEVSFFGDHLPGSVHWIKEKDKNSKFCYSSLLFNFLNKNF